MKIPSHGLSRAEVFARLETYRRDDTPWREGRTWAYVYDPGPEAEAVVKDAFASYLGENGLDPTAFPSALRMENEVVSMAASHLHGLGQAACPRPTRSSRADEGVVHAIAP